MTDRIMLYVLFDVKKYQIAGIMSHRIDRIVSYCLQRKT